MEKERLAKLKSLRSLLIKSDYKNSFCEYANDPVGFVRNILNEHLWSRQAMIAEALREHRRVAVPSCHDSGKSFLAARMAAWWIATNITGEAFVVTSAPTQAQVRAILWREIGRAHIRGRLPGYVTQTEWRIDGHLVGFGRKPNAEDPTAFQGIHARRVLVVFDEACGIPQNLWDAAETLIANDESRMLAIGNPDDPDSAFGRVCRPGSEWKILAIDAFDTPNLSGEPVPEKLKPLLVSRLWVEEQERRWGRDSPMWQAKVRGKFPKLTTNSMFFTEDLRAAVARTLSPGEPVELGVDVARYGGDETIIVQRSGSVARLAGCFTKMDLMSLTGNVVDLARKSCATSIKVDDTGIGGGVVDRLRELGLPVIAINGASRPLNPERFLNLRIELAWGLAERVRTGDIDLEDDDILLTQLSSLRHEMNSRGQIKLESKENMRKRGVTSPDRADALILAFAVNPVSSQNKINWDFL